MWNLERIMAGEWRRPNEDRSQQTLQGIIRVGRVVNQPYRVVFSADLSLHGHPILIRLLVAGCLSLNACTRHLYKGTWLSNGRRDLELQDLFALVPVDDESKLYSVDRFELRNVED